MHRLNLGIGDFLWRAEHVNGNFFTTAEEEDPEQPGEGLRGAAREQEAEEKQIMGEVERGSENRRAVG